MFKKFLLTIVFFLVFLFQPPKILNIITVNNDFSTKVVYAQDSTNSGSTFKTAWNAIISWLFPTLKGSKRYASKSYLAPNKDTSKELTDYESGTKDYSSRMLSSSDKKRQMGAWFYDILTRPNDYPPNQVISQASYNCPQITIGDLLYFFYIKEEKILYKHTFSIKALDYNDNIVSLINKMVDNHNIRTSLLNETCYRNAYNNNQTVPQGLFQKQGDAALSSLQLNKIFRTSVPQKTQGEDAPEDNKTIQRTEQLVEDSIKQERTMLLAQIPKTGQDEIDCSGDENDVVQDIRKRFGKWLTPQSWMSNSSNSSDNNSKPPSRTDVNGNNASNCAQSGHGNGMSQYGAYGMAMSGFNYVEILSAYYGIGEDYNLNMDFAFVNSSSDKITVRLIEDSEACDRLVANNSGVTFGQNETIDGKKIVTPTPTPTPINYNEDDEEEKEEEGYRTVILTVDTYLRGLAEMPGNWLLSAHQAQIVAARSFAYRRTSYLKNSIRNTAQDQVFSCGRVSSSASNNQNKAIALTAGTVITQNGKTSSTAYSSCHGKASGSAPYFDGTFYERLAKGPVKSVNGICESYTTLPVNSNGIQNLNVTLVNGIYVFEGERHGGRIAEDYDIGHIDGGKWVQTYNDRCQLDSRVFPALDLMIAAAKTDIPSLDLRLVSCYRSINTQQRLWEKALKKYGSPEKARVWVAPPGNSAHHTGRAIDFGDSSMLRRSSTLYKWMLSNAAKYGWYNYKAEPWHWEYNP